MEQGVSDCMNVSNYLAHQLNGDIAKAFFIAAHEMFDETIEVLNYLMELSLVDNTVNEKHTITLGKALGIYRPAYIETAGDDLIVQEDGFPASDEWIANHSISELKPNGTLWLRGEGHGGAFVDELTGTSASGSSLVYIDIISYQRYILHVISLRNTFSIDSLLNIIELLFNIQSATITFDADASIRLKLPMNIRSSFALLEKEINKIFST